MAVTKGKIAKVEFATIETKEVVGTKTVLNSKQEFARLTLETGEQFIVSGKGGIELQKWGSGQKVKVTQEKGKITFEKL